MLKTFYDLGYYVQWRVINAGDYLMPQKCRRGLYLPISKKKYSKGIKVLDLTTSNISNNFNDGKFLETGIMKE